MKRRRRFIPLNPDLNGCRVACFGFAHTSVLQLQRIATTATPRRRRQRFSSTFSANSQSAPVQPDPSSPDKESSGVFVVDEDGKRSTPSTGSILERLWKVAAPYWSSDDKVSARFQLAAVFVLLLGSVLNFVFLGRDVYYALANKDQEQFTKQLLYYLGGFAVGIPVSIFLLFLSLPMVKTQRVTNGNAKKPSTKEIMQQRLAFARLLLSKPKLVLLDEATSALDEAIEAFLYQQIEAACLTVSIGHRKTLVSYHKRVLHISPVNPDTEKPNWYIQSADQMPAYELS